MVGFTLLLPIRICFTILFAMSQSPISSPLLSLPVLRGANTFFPTADDIPQEFRLPQPILQQEYLVNGELRAWHGATQDVFSPIHIRSGEQSAPLHIGHYPIAGSIEAHEALDSAVAAYNNGRGEWAMMSIRERIDCMEHFIAKMLERKHDVVLLLMWEIGKSYTDSVKEFDRTIQYMYDTIDSLKDLDRSSSRFRIEQGVIGQIRRSSLGVVLCMGPFNYPLNETYTLLIPALLMGNTILFKPPKHGTLLHYPLLSAFQECFPKGVMNTVYGRGSQVIPELMQSGKVNVLTLIGSSRVADQLKKMHPKTNRLKAVLGLDAKNPAIVLDNADLDLTIKECVLGTLSFNGQRCTAIKIIWVHRSIAETFLQKFSSAISELKAGMPWSPGVALTPLPEPGKPAYIAECLADAHAHGAKIVNEEQGGATLHSFVSPAVVYPVTPAMKLYREEQFGPVIPVVPFDDIEEPIQYIISSDHGQQVSIFATHPQDIADLVDPLVNQVSRVNINAQCQRGPDTFPFTGRKDSAEGTLSVEDALRAFSIRTLVATKDTPANKAIVNTIVETHSSKFLSTKFIF